MEDLVVCKECGLSFRWITAGHLRSSHGLTIEEYQLKYPGSSLLASETKIGNWVGTSTGSRWKGLSEEERKTRVGRISKSVKAYQAGLSEEEKLDLSKKRSVGLERMWLGRSDEEKADILGRSLHTEGSKDKASVNRRATWSLKSEEEMQDFLSKGLHSKESKLRKQVGVQKYWDELSPEFKEVRMRAVARGNKKGRSDIEELVGCYLDARFPDEWVYGGSGPGAVTIGGLSPDFIHTKKKVVVEVLGEYWHSAEVKGRDPVEEEAFLIDHYKRHGYSCIIIWGPLQTQNLFDLDEVFFS